ncbi:MAG TPA: LysR family transcriptional regulator [Clostridiales bacterium]|nr:LysR family transcriptional regulator [Clostridiales bacterium]
MDINFELYKIFYQAAASGSFSEAAARLFISQSAVSQAIKNLESKIGSRLFYRKSRSIKLTPEGQLLYSHIEQAYNFIKTGEDKIIQLKNLELGEIRIGIGDTICRYYLIPYLQEFNRRYPNIKIRVVNRTSNQIIHVLKNGIIDFGIVTLPVNEKNISVIDFLTVEDIFVASERFSGLNDKIVKLCELSNYPILTLEQESSTRRLLDEFLASNGVKMVPEIELESIELLVEFAKIGLGIAHVLKESAAEAIKSGELFQIKTTEKLPLRKLGIANMKQIPLSTAAKEFIKIMTFNNCHQ